jgi:transposase-like protein
MQSRSNPQNFREMNDDFDFFNKLLYDIDYAVMFFKENNLIEAQKQCIHCQSVATIQHSIRYINNHCYRCSNNACRKRFRLTDNTIFENPRILLTHYSRVIFSFVLGLNNSQACFISNISENTYIEIKSKIYPILRDEINELGTMLGGEGVALQVDETAICRGMIITNPTTTQDNIPNTQWLVGIIEESEKRPFIFKIVPNRTVETFISIFRKHVRPNSIIKTDGYPSYPSAVRAINCHHVVVNHSQGFINDDGEHTNLIENLWSHLKTEYRRRRGVRIVNMLDYLTEFEWRKKFLKYKNRKVYSSTFFRLLFTFATLK